LDAPFSTEELPDAAASAPPEPELHVASDGVQLAMRAYPASEPRAALVFYHGGGAHSGAGYPALARGIRDCAATVVYTPDIRGHGASGGPRGDAPSAEQLWRDVATLLAAVSARHPGLPLYVGGHSSGAALALNYLGRAKESDVALAGIVMLAPQLGFRSKTGRPDLATEFAAVRTWPFVLNAMSGGRLLGHYPAVQFAYPAELFDHDPGMVGFNTVNMANAITPWNPQQQFRQLSRPLGLWIGADDELFVADKVIAYAELIGSADRKNCARVVDDATHLGILVRAHELIGPWIASQVLAPGAAQ